MVIFDFIFSLRICTECHYSTSRTNLTGQIPDQSGKAAELTEDEFLHFMK